MDKKILKSSISDLEQNNKNINIIIDDLDRWVLRDSPNDNKPFNEHLMGRLRYVVQYYSVQDIPLDDISKYLSESNKLRNSVSELINHAATETDYEIMYKRAIKEDELKLKWREWAERLARWVLGTFVAFVLYSTAVSLSESWSFFKVPVRDMVINGQ